MQEYHSLSDAIKDIFGDGCSLTGRSYVSGGDINQTSALTLNDGTKLFLKSNTPDMLSNFREEVNGLEAIRNTGAIGVPKVLALGTDGGCAFLLMEYLVPGKEIREFWEIFAQELAAMHRADAGEQYGFPTDNWIGSWRQINTYHDSWIAFFRDCRLKPQFRAARRYFNSGELKKIDHLLENLDRYLPEPERPSLIHGDLWSGNMITGNDGKGWLIDPAVYYGHPEADIAMTELFGGFSRRFYETYREAGALDSGCKERRDLYNLYHLLNHLNMFGIGYLSSVRSIVGRYG